MHTEQEENKKHCVPLFLFKLAQQLWHFFLVELHQTPDQPPPILPRKSISIAESVSLPNMYVKSPTKAQKAGLFVFTFKYLMLQWFLTPIPWYLEQQWPKIRKLKYYVDFNLSFSFLPPKKKKSKETLWLRPWLWVNRGCIDPHPWKPVLLDQEHFVFMYTKEYSLSS